MIEIETVSFHRNGVSGESFYAIAFIDSEYGNMLGVVFDYESNKRKRKFYNPRTAVFNRDKIGEGEVRFFHNSFRGDHYHDELMAAIDAHIKEEEGKYNA